MAAELTALLSRWQPEIAVLETPFLGMNTRSLVVLAQARGALLAALAAQGLEIDEYTPAEVKNAVTGHGRADKGQVAKMVGLHLSLAENQLSEDAADALAIAICFAQRGRMDRILSGRG
jgi:crossover junction endodeoxyribonuclease RuvC